jgi:hypothetical protein
MRAAHRCRLSGAMAPTDRHRFGPRPPAPLLSRRGGRALALLARRDADRAVRDDADRPHSGVEHPPVSVRPRGHKP